jgi:hypothetical protein
MIFRAHFFISSKGSKKKSLQMLRPIGSAIEAGGVMNPTITFCKKHDFKGS